MAEIKAYQRAELRGRGGQDVYLFIFYSSKAGRCCDSILHFKPTSYGGLRHFKKWNLSWMYSAGCWIYFQDKTLTYCCVAHTHWGAKRQVMLNQSQQLGNTSAGLRKEKKTTYFSFHTNKRAQISDGYTADTYILLLFFPLKTASTRESVFFLRLHPLHCLTWTILTGVWSLPHLTSSKEGRYLCTSNKIFNNQS